MDYKEAYWKPSPNAARFFRRWQPEKKEQSIVVILHGYGEHGGRYGELASRLTADGSTVYAPDLPGHGRSDGTPAYIPRIESFAEEIGHFIREVVGPPEGTPLFLMGHSMGGGLALLFAIEYQQLFHGLILSGAAVRTGGGSSAAVKLIARIVAAAAPRLPLVPFASEGISRSEDVVRSYKKDPLVYTGRMRARTGTEILRLESLFPPERLAELKLPVLIYHGGADPIMPPASSEYLYRHVGSGDKLHKVFPSAYHEVHHEPEREELFELLRSWIAGHRDN
jgi:alpha-beta hydrolase superfamily lysophospholipase